MSLHDHACLESVDGQAVTLLGARLTGELRGLLFAARVEQRFVNPGDEHLEVVYRFPLPWGAVLLGIEVELGGKRLTGAVVARAQAEADYEEALSQGDAAIMLEKNHDDSYCLNLGNLAPRERCTITLRYAQVLPFEQGALRLLIPTTIAPRYEDGAHASPVPQHQRMASSLTAEHGLELELTLHGSLARARVASPSHAISVVSAESEGQGADEGIDGGAVLRVALARQAWLDRDFVLVLDQLAHSSLALAGADYAQPGQATVLASFCPRLADQAPLDVTVKILVDCSGSMGGDSIGAARRALQAVVLQLRGADRFSLSRFGSSVEHRARGLWKVSDATRLAAQRWVGTLEADLGGTDMQAALESTLQLAHSVRSDVLLVTDGQIGSVDAVIAAARGSGHRVFVVGIGSSVVQSHLQRLAAATGGACDFVAPGEAVEPAVLRMFARLRSPHLEDLRLEWPGQVQPLWASALPSAVFDGDTVNVFAGFAQVPQGVVRLLGRAGSVAPEQELGRAALDARVSAAPTLARVAAAARLAALTPDDAHADAQDEGVRLAVDYQLVSDETNFLLLHERAAADKAGQMPRLHQERPMLAAGWGGAGSVSLSRMRADIWAGGVPALQRRSPIRQIEARAFRSIGSARSDRLRSFLDDLNDDAPLVPAKPAKPRIDRNDPRYWTRSEFYTGLTPLGLQEWLRINPESEWPATYEELRDIGLGAPVVEWLELLFKNRVDAGMPESAVVMGFLAAIDGGAWQASRKSSRRSSPTQDREKVREFFLGALERTTPQEWPESVWTLEERLDDD